MLKGCSGPAYARLRRRLLPYERNRPVHEPRTVQVAGHRTAPTVALSVMGTKPCELRVIEAWGALYVPAAVRESDPFEFNSAPLPDTEPLDSVSERVSVAVAPLPAVTLRVQPPTIVALGVG